MENNHPRSTFRQIDKNNIIRNRLANLNLYPNFSFNLIRKFYLTTSATTYQPNYAFRSVNKLVCITDNTSHTMCADEIKQT